MHICCVQTACFLIVFNCLDLLICLKTNLTYNLLLFFSISHSENHSFVIISPVFASVSNFKAVIAPLTAINVGLLLVTVVQ